MKSVNVILVKLCESNGFIFINNSHITQMHLAEDGLHLKAHWQISEKWCDKACDKVCQFSAL